MNSFIKLTFFVTEVYKKQWPLLIPDKTIRIG